LDNYLRTLILVLNGDGVISGSQFATLATPVFTGDPQAPTAAAGGTSWGSLSDERKKDIIEPITGAIAKTCSLRTVIGKYKTDAADKRRVFLIAQDVQAVLPEAVIDNDDELSLQYTDMIPLLTAAIKEQQALIETLQSRISTLEGI
jgi:hypothetical protein